MGKMITITAAEYARLQAALTKLTALENAGVSDWEAYGEAMSAFNEEEEEED